MTWNYRIVRVTPAPLTVEVDGCECQPEHYHMIAEVYYDNAGQPDGFAHPDDTKPYGDTPEELKSDLELMLKAFDHSILDLDDLAKKEGED